MKIVFISHPFFLGHQSMPRYLYMLADGMKKRGHEIEILAPADRVSRLAKGRTLKKWLGYVDQFIIFPTQLRARAKQLPHDVLFVFTDHALGPWVPLVKERLHIIHCHDFLAQRAALGQIPGQRVGVTGRLYQRYIRKGYSEGCNFISVSQNTQKDLHAFLGRQPAISEVVYNGINAALSSGDSSVGRSEIGDAMGFNARNGYLLHVGGNQWYKNRPGVIEIYAAYRKQSESKVIPLLLVGEAPDDELRSAVSGSGFAADIHFASGKNDQFIRTAYSGAVALLFPSLAEGFGWPIAEAMACGCPVITTNEVPMTEVGADAAMYINRMPHTSYERTVWAQKSSEMVDQVVRLSDSERNNVLQKGYENIKRFEAESVLDQIETVYKRVLSSQKP